MIILSPKEVNLGFVLIFYYLIKISRISDKVFSIIDKGRVINLVFAHFRPIFFIYAPIAIIFGMYILCIK